MHADRPAPQVPSLVTLDIDWAPDAAIDHAAHILEHHGVRATWFVTHATPALDRLRARSDLFELGIHPNFLAGSSHGSTPDAVLAHCMSLAPEARSMRAHALVQSTPILDRVLATTPVRCDASLFLPGATTIELIEYLWKGRTLLRLPYHFEDDIEMMRPEPRWDPAPHLDCRGYRVFDFHPIHIFLNSADMSPYEQLKATVQPLGRAREEEMRPFRNPTPGAGTLFEAIVRRIGEEGTSRCVRDVITTWDGLNP